MAALSYFASQYRAYLNRGLGPQDRRFWWIFGGSLLVSCTGFYGYSYYIQSSISANRTLDELITAGFVLAPAFSLRRLQYFIPVLGMATFTRYWWILLLLVYVLYKQTFNRPI